MSNAHLVNSFSHKFTMGFSCLFDWIWLGEWKLFVVVFIALRRTVSVTVKLKWSIQVVLSLLTITQWLMFVFSILFCIPYRVTLRSGFDMVPVNNIPDVLNRHLMGCWNKEVHVSINPWLCPPTWANGKTAGLLWLSLYPYNAFVALLPCAFIFVIIQEKSGAQMWIPIVLFTCLSLYMFNNCLWN